MQEGVSSAHRRDPFLAALLHLASFARGLHFGHDVGERLLHRLLQDPALALALGVLRVGQRGQGGVDVLQAHGHGNLQGDRGNMSETTASALRRTTILNAHVIMRKNEQTELQISTGAGKYYFE